MTFSNFGETCVVSTAVNCWSQLQHTANCWQETKLTLYAKYCSLCGFHYEPVCVLKYGETTKALRKALATQFNVKGRQIAISPLISQYQTIGDLRPLIVWGCQSARQLLGRQQELPLTKQCPLHF